MISSKRRKQAIPDGEVTRFQNEPEKSEIIFRIWNQALILVRERKDQSAVKHEVLILGKRAQQSDQTISNTITVHSIIKEFLYGRQKLL